MLLFLLYITAVLWGMICRNGKVSFYFSFFIAWLLMAGNYDNADYENYIIRYDRGLEVLVDPGFSIINYIFSSAGFSFAELKTVISFFCLILVFKSISILCANRSFGAALFLIFPLIIDITQFRNFVAYSIFYAAVPYLFENSKTSTIKYYVITLIAVSFHAALDWYLFLPLAKRDIKLKFVIIGVIGLFTAKEMLMLLIQQYIGTDRLELFDKPSIAGALFGAFTLVINAVVVNTLYKREYYDIELDEYVDAYWMDKMWVNVNWLLLFIIPFLFDNGNYSRIFRNIVLLNMIFILNSYYLSKQTKTLVIAAYLAFFVFMNYLAGTYFEEVFSPIFSYNFILSE